jgi:phage/plasmid primase-like uncharacterized protein
MLDPDHIARAHSMPIAAVLAARGHHLRRCGGELTGPCPVCGGTDRFAVNVRKNIWNCRGCGRGGDVIELVRHLSGYDFTEAVARLTGETGTVIDHTTAPPDLVRRTKANANAADAEYQRRQHEKAAWLWSQRRPIKGTIAEKYLQGRGITCLLQSTLAFLPPRSPEHHPAMIAAFGLPDEPEPGVLGEPRNVKAVHLTLLRRDGSEKADVEPQKLFVGSPGNLPIVLAPPNDLLGMAITEGIEDALTVHQTTGLGAWAAGSAGRMPALAEMLPGYIECVTICAHADKAGQDGALALADALDRRGVEVFIQGIRP